MTILGKHTMTETRELISVIEYRYQQTDKAVAAAIEKVRKAIAEKQPYDVAAATDLDYDWSKLAKRWEKERDEVASSLRMKAISLLTVPANLIATEEEWQRVLPYVQADGWTKGTWLNIRSRLQKLGVEIDLKDEPRQGAKDWDIDSLRNLDTAIQGIEGAATQAKTAVGNAATSKTGIMIGLGLAGAVATAIVVKHYL